MAKKPASGRSRKPKKAAKAAPRSKRVAKPKAAARAKAASKPQTAAKKAKAAAKPSGAAKPKAAAKSTAAAKPGAARAKAAPSRAIQPRREPETLRCKGMSLSLTVDDLARSMRFYVDGLGFHVKDRWERDGKLLGVEMVAGTCLLGISQDDWAKGRDRTKGVGMSIYLESSTDVDALAARCKARGVDARGPEATPWGARALYLTDPDGFKLTLYQEKAG